MNVNICPSLLVFTCCLGAKINVNIFPQILLFACCLGTKINMNICPLSPTIYVLFRRQI